MSVIVPELILAEMFPMLPHINIRTDLDKAIQFGYGTKKELNRYLAVQKENSYPIVWLLNPAPETQTNNRLMVERDCSFVIATRETRTELYDPQRYQGSYKNVLHPVFVILEDALTYYNRTRIVGELSPKRHTNYSETENQEQSGVIDLWDALRVDCRIEFNQHHCKNDLSWITVA